MIFYEALYVARHLCRIKCCTSHGGIYKWGNFGLGFVNDKCCQIWSIGALDTWEAKEAKTYNLTGLFVAAAKSGSDEGDARPPWMDQQLESGVAWYQMQSCRLHRHLHPHSWWCFPWHRRQDSGTWFGLLAFCCKRRILRLGLQSGDKYYYYVTTNFRTGTVFQN